MEFKISITWWAAGKSAYTPGWEEIDQLRAAAGRELPLAMIGKTALRQSLACCKIFVHEVTARKAEIFREEGTASVRVYMTREEAERFFIRASAIERDPETMKVIEAHIEWIFDEEKFLKFWEGIGFPEEIKEVNSNV